MRSRNVVTVLSLLLCAALPGCKVTTEDIDYWMGTQKGPGKIVAVLLADKYEDELRVYAGLALVRMEPRPPSTTSEPIDGVTELQAAVRRLPEETRRRIVDLMIPDLVNMMRGEDTPQATEGDAVGLLQIRAKDAAFLILPYASEAQGAQLRDEIVDWFARDFNGRNLAGNFSAEQVVRQLGAPAASRLVNAMNAQLPQQALVKVAELISTLGSSATKEAAGQRLVDIEREMESAEFTSSLVERLRQQIRRERGEDVEINQDALTRAAIENRENFITLGALPAMRHLNDQRVVQDRLLELAQTAQVEGLLPPRVEERRVKALQAMEGGVRREQVDALLDLALAEASPLAVRDYAFDRVADSRSTAAIPRLWPVFRETSDWRVRWRVGSLILTLGGNDVVQEFFGALPPAEYAREELHGYGERLASMRPPPADFVLGQLTSSDWHKRCIALYYLERRAQEPDIARITALEGDAAETRGRNWEDQTTVGRLAAAVARAVRERLGQGTQANDESGSSGEGE
ncbi:MAG: hypothetical protein KF729_24875 [Sandaracinaceae bacterium]|nr:hypothetical protein [Sandaracinaceae bacterium]